MSVLTQDPTLADRSQPRPIQFNLNGKSVTVIDELDRSLLGVLREDLGCTSLKNGCEPQASCGCCTLLIDGKPRLSCTIKPQQAAGKTVTTLEGLPEEIRRQIAFDLRGNLCRCTGYVKIVDAIEQYAALRRGEQLPANDNSGKVGTPLP